jgi:hypothetical protein
MGICVNPRERLERIPARIRGTEMSVNGQVCVHCKFSAEPRTEPKNPNFYCCHLGPPQWQIYEGNTLGQFPPVLADDWCGQFEPKKEAEKEIAT